MVTVIIIKLLAWPEGSKCFPLLIASPLPITPLEKGGNYFGANTLIYFFFYRILHQTEDFGLKANVIWYMMLGDTLQSVLERQLHMNESFIIKSVYMMPAGILATVVITRMIPYHFYPKIRAVEIPCMTGPSCPISLRTSKKFQFTCPGMSTS